MINYPSERRPLGILPTLALTGVLAAGVASITLIQEVRKILDDAVGLLEKSPTPAKNMGSEPEACDSTAFCPLPVANTAIQ